MHRSRLSRPHAGAAAVLLLIACSVLPACRRERTAPERTPDPAVDADPAQNIAWTELEELEEIRALAERLPVPPEAPEFDREAFELVSTRTAWGYDAFRYDLYYDSDTGNYWVVETGGIGGGARWFGPATEDAAVVQRMLGLADREEGGAGAVVP